MILAFSKKMIATAILSLTALLSAVYGQCTLQCANGGICSIDFSSDKEFCTCLQGYQGELCDAEIDIPCTICSDSTQSFNANKLIPYLNTTCREFELFVAMEDDQELCSLARKTASWCECPGAEGTCSLCPDGTNPMNSDLMVPYSSGLSCRDYVFFAAIVPEGPECASFDFLAEFCGGCVEAEPTSSPFDDRNQSSMPSSNAAPAPTPTVSPAPTVTMSPTDSPTVTSAPTRTPSPTIASPISSTISPSVTSTPTRSPSPTIASSISSTFSSTVTSAPTRTPSPTIATPISSTISPTATSAPTRTPSPTIATPISSTISPTVTSAPTRTPSPTIATPVEPSENPTSNSPHLGFMISSAFFIVALVLLI